MRITAENIMILEYIMAIKPEYSVKKWLAQWQVQLIICDVCLYNYVCLCVRAFGCLCVHICILHIHSIILMYIGNIFK